METLNPHPPEKFHVINIQNQSLVDYQSVETDGKHDLNDSVNLNSPLHNSVRNSTCPEDSFNITIEQPEEVYSLHNSARDTLTQDAALEKTPQPVKEVSKSDLELHKLQREKALIGHLLKCIPSLNENFLVHRKIGEGTFSSVFLATVKDGGGSPKRYAVKHLVPTCHPSRIEKELRCLMEIGGRDNVVGVDLCLRNGLNVAFVMPFMPHNHFTDYMTRMDIDEIKLYMRNLLVALQRVHSFGVIHRDVKPSNFLYDRVGKRFLLVDFGLAHDVGDFCGSNKEISTSVFLSPKKRKRSEDKLDDENSVRQKIPCRADLLGGTPRRPLHTLEKVLDQGQVTMSTPQKSLIGSPTRRPLGDYQGGNICSAKKPNPILSKRMPASRPSGEFCMLEPKQKSAGGLVIRVQNSKVVSSPALTARNALLRRPLFSPDNHRKLLVSNQSPLQPPMPLPPVSSQLASAPAPLSASKSVSGGPCSCRNLPRVCRSCLTQKPYFAPRAGTPGFRPPEVLLKSHHQTTAVDMWAAGVILLCIASGCYPFFRSPDDITALAEIMTVFGTMRLEKVAVKLGRKIICSNRRPAMDLQFLCEKLRSRGENDSSRIQLPAEAYSLLNRLLDLDPHTRISADEALRDPFLSTG